MARIKNNRRTRSLNRIMTLLVSAIIIVAITVTVLVFVSIYRSNLYQTVQMNSEQVVSQTANTIDIYYEGMREDLDLVSKNISDCETQQKAEDFLNMMARTRNDIAAIMIYDKSGTLLACGADGKIRKKHILKNLSFDEEEFSKEKEIYITSPHVETLFKNDYPWVVTIAQKQKDSVYGEEVFVALDVRFSSIASFLDEIGIGQYGYCFLINDNNDIVYHPQQQIIYSGMKDENVLLIGSLADGTEYIDGTMYTLKTLENETWRVVGISYIGQFVDSAVRNLLGTVMIIGVVIILAALACVYVFSRRLSKPITELVDAMHRFEQDAAQFQYEAVGGIWEIQNMSESFEHMTKMIQQLMEQVKQEEITLRKTELKALYAQINPHFLYNTLDSILWMCEQNRSQEAVAMVDALAKLFRISISRGHEMIRIEDEIRHAQSYLAIQSVRYKNQFHYEFDVQDSILDYYCNKITLQPIIENAIYHGIDRMIDEGEIYIRAVEEGDDICFMVRDNGVGMTPEMTKQLLNSDSYDDRIGIGVKNVNDRIQIYFGAQYGVQIESELDVGTTVWIRFPKVKERMDETR